MTQVTSACNYPSAPAGRVDRGGCWDSGADDCRVTFRDGYDADRRWNCLGGRLLRWNIDT